MDCVEHKNARASLVYGTREFSEGDAAKKRIDDAGLFVLDMDGTLYLDDDVIDGAIEFCETILKKGRKLVYFTNNASRSPEEYVKRLVRLGFPCTRSNIVTSGDVTAAFLNRYHKGEKVYVMGTPALCESLASAGIPLADIHEEAPITLVSFDKTLTYERLEHACTLIRNGSVFYSTHPDINCPTKDGFIPDSGALCAAISLSTGKQPRYFGKPYAETAEMLALMSGVPKEKIAMIGDRLYTDIALGRRNGLCSILVMSGETTEKMRLAAPEDQTADLVFPSVREIIPLL